LVTSWGVPAPPAQLSYLSHAKETASLRRVAGILWSQNREQRPEIRVWLRRHRPRLSLASVASAPLLHPV
jgi:hypothetical protein